MARIAEEWGRLYPLIRDNDLAFSEFLGFRPTHQQRAVFETIARGASQKHNKVAIVSGQGVGKTTSIAEVAIRRLLRYPGTGVVCTAPTQRQVKDLLLMEISKLVGNAPRWFQNMFDIQTNQIKICGRRDWTLTLVASNKTTNAQGYHRPFGQTIIMDEASGISREISETFLGTQSGEDALTIQIGNPNLRDCAFFDNYTYGPQTGWGTLRLSSEDAPDWLVNKQNLKELEHRFGRESDVYRVRVLGLFPSEDPNCVVSSDILYACANPDRLFEMASITGRNGKVIKQFGLDFARFGSDESVVVRRQGNALVEIKTFAHTEPVEVVEYAFERQQELRWLDRDTNYVPDASGMGQGVLFMFSRHKKNHVEFHNGASSADLAYADKVTEAWFHFADLAKKGLVYIPKDDDLIRQLSSRQYRITSAGQIKLESKDDYKRRTDGKSPDRADACVMAFYDTEKSRVRVIR